MRPSQQTAQLTIERDGIEILIEVEADCYPYCPATRHEPGQAESCEITSAHVIYVEQESSNPIEGYDKGQSIDLTPEEDQKAQAAIWEAIQTACEDAASEDPINDSELADWE